MDQTLVPVLRDVKTERTIQEEGFSKFIHRFWNAISECPSESFDDMNLEIAIRRLKLGVGAQVLSSFIKIELSSDCALSIFVDQLRGISKIIFNDLINIFVEREMVVSPRFVTITRAETAPTQKVAFF